MPLTFISGIAVELPQRFTAGQAIDETEAEILSQIHVSRIRGRLGWMLKQGTITEAELPSKAEELALLDLSPLTINEADEDDPILAEALIIARDMITQRLASEGLAPPKNLDEHAKVLIDALPHIRAMAVKRLEERHKIARESLIL